MENLVPMCKNCNEDWKHNVNPINTDKDIGNQRKTFYPFDINLSNLTVSISDLEIDPLYDEDGHSFNIDYNCKDYVDEVNTWLELFNIYERYDDVIRINLKFWLEEFRILNDKDNDTSKMEYIENKIDNKFINKNFLNLAVIEARKT